MNWKTFIVFVVGVLVGGMLFGLQGPVPSQAGGSLPMSLFSYHSNEGNYQFLQIRDQYRNTYKVAGCDANTGVDYLIGVLVEGK